MYLGPVGYSMRVSKIPPSSSQRVTYREPVIYTSDEIDTNVGMIAIRTILMYICPYHWINNLSETVLNYWKQEGYRTWPA